VIYVKAAGLFRAAPAYTLAVAVTMALGIGANTAVFSVVYGVILRPLPFRDANQLVRLWSRNDARHLEFFSVSPADYHDACRSMRAIRGEG
jgi:putative ABC transport system permease protein